ncbi:MAG: chloride channel protein [Rhodospirillaceae bacterium]|nr:chloride channel protein [Rhodospirillaceae bacterium]
MTGPSRRLSFATLRSKAAQALAGEQMSLTVLAVLIGALGGYGSLAFRKLIDGFQFFVYGSGSEHVLAMAGNLAWWHLLLAPAAGGLVVGLLIRYLLPGGRPQGVPDVMIACHLRSGRIPLKEGLSAALTSALALGAGASVGREGPVVHLGASLASAVALKLRLRSSATLTVFGCGVASAVAASFNAPIAGVFFALEVVVGHYGLGAFAPVVIASVVGTVITRIHIGDFPAFQITGTEIASFSEIPAFAILGIVSAGVAIAFISGTMLVQRGFGRIPVPQWVRPGIGGLLVGGIAILFPQVIGVGYETTDLALKNAFPVELALTLAAAKALASAISLGSGFAGGVFSPALCIGALVGSAFGAVAAAVFPGVGAMQNAYALVGMGTVAGAVLGAPISTMLIIFELTGDYKLTIAVMVAVSLSSLITRQLYGHSFFTRQLAQRGIAIDAAREAALLRSVPVTEVMVESFRSIQAEAPFKQLTEMFREAAQPEVYVLDQEGVVIGEVEFSDVGPAIFRPDSDTRSRAVDASRRLKNVIASDETLESAIQRLRQAGVDRLPVVVDRRTRVMIGVLRLQDAVQTHNRLLIAARAEEHGER